MGIQSALQPVALSISTRRRNWAIRSTTQFQTCRDHDINDNFASIKTAEGMIGHEFQIGTAASKAKWANPAKDVDYDFNPALDEDVISTRSNLNLSEGQLGH